jgi:hypothetical protein
VHSQGASRGRSNESSPIFKPLIPAAAKRFYQDIARAETARRSLSMSRASTPRGRRLTDELRHSMVAADPTN